MLAFVTYEGVAFLPGDLNVIVESFLFLPIPKNYHTVLNVFRSAVLALVEGLSFNTFTGFHLL